MMKPPRLAPPCDPAVAEALDAIAKPRPPRRFTPPQRPAEQPDPARTILRLRRGRGSELVVSLHTHDGRPFARVSLRGASGKARRSVALRPDELDALADALRAARAELAAPVEAANEAAPVDRR